MPLLRRALDGRVFRLLPTTRIGRAADSDLRLGGEAPSRDHAAIDWTGATWQIRDLGSRNGTFVDGQRLGSGERMPLARGQMLLFGHPDDPWAVEDVTPPVASAAPLGGGDPVWGDEDGVALPGLAAPLGVVRRDEEGGWALETDDVVTPLDDRSVVQVGGRPFRLHLPTSSSPTALQAAAWEVFRAHFFVSADEERAAVRLDAGENRWELPLRAHLYLLLTLGRQRLADQRAGVDAAGAGWASISRLAGDLDIRPNLVHVHLWRTRQQLREAGFPAVDRLVEKRTSGELRLGTPQVTIERVHG